MHDNKPKTEALEMKESWAPYVNSYRLFWNWGMSLWKSGEVKSWFLIWEEKNTTMSYLQKICSMASRECSLYTHVMPFVEARVIHIYRIYIQLPQNGSLFSNFTIDSAKSKSTRIIFWKSSEIFMNFAKNRRIGYWEIFLPELEIQI